ncbi:unnamed protein product [Musa acuminata subsp. burmannicoides]
MSASAERDPDRGKEVVGVRLSLLFRISRASDSPAQHEDKEISEQDQVSMRLAGATKCSSSPVFCSRLLGVIGGMRRPSHHFGMEARSRDTVRRRCW